MGRARYRLPHQREATYEDLLRVPDTKVAEILDGELFVSPRPSPQHALASSALGGALHPAFGRQGGSGKGPGGWWILDEPELHMGKDVVVPDLAGWRRERMPCLPDTAYFSLAPDWAGEVVSPHTAGADRVRKLDIYTRERVTHLWLIDPLARTVEVFHLAAGEVLRIAAHEGRGKVRFPPFEALELDLDELWPPEEGGVADAGEPVEEATGTAEDAGGEG